MSRLQDDMDRSIEATLAAALGLSDRGASAPTNPIAISAAIAAVAIVAGLGFVSLLPRPSTVAAAPLFIQADQADRQAIEERFERLVLEIRLLKLGEERRDGEFGAKEFPAATPGLRTWGEK
jgi:hypothetical protein